MKRIWWILGLALAFSPLTGLDQALAQRAAGDSAASKPNAALLMRLSRARQLSNQPRTFQTQVGVAVAARRHGDQIEQQKQTLAILNNQYLRGTAATTPSESDIQQTASVLEGQLNAPNPPENAYEIRYYLSACYESLGQVDKAKEFLRAIIDENAQTEDEVAKTFVEQARADLERLGA